MDGCGTLSANQTLVNSQIVGTTSTVVTPNEELLGPPTLKLELSHSISNRANSGAEAFLTLRLLMSYIYMEHLFLMFLDHTQRRSTVGRTPLDE